MPAKKMSLQEKLAKLREKFVGQLPERLEELNNLCKQLLQESSGSQGADSQHPKLEAITLLHRALHSLKGTAASFGFEKLTHLSDSGETLAKKALDALAVDATNAELNLAKLSASAQAVMRELNTQIHNPSSSPSQQESYVEPEIPSSDKQLPLVYVCDDQEEQITYLVGQLASFGFQVKHFSSTQELRTAFIQEQPDALIMDVHFPNGNTAGTEELAYLNQLTSQPIPAVVLSANDDFDSRLSAVRAGAKGYFLKPVRSLDLATALDNLISKPLDEKLRILIVDDDAMAAAYHAEILTSADMQAYIINKPEEIIDALRQHNPDLVLVDIYMPKCDGIEMSSLIRQMPEYYSLPLVFLSSENNPSKQFTAMQVGVEGFITKPVEPEELIATVKLSAQRMRSLRNQMLKDSLTGLYNHTSTSELKSAAVQQAKHNQESLVMAMIDLDYFKKVNDTYGHMAGDKVLIALARLLKNNLRSTDIVGRFGGEEFAVLLKNTNLTQAKQTLDKLREDFSKLVFVSGEKQFQVTFSAGLSAFPECTTGVSLRLAADEALYKAKELGRNRIHTA